MVVHGRGRDEDRAGVDALAAGEALDGERGVDDAPGILVLVVGVDEVLRVLVGVLGLLVHRGEQRGVGRARDHLRELLAHPHRVVQHAGCVVDGLFGLDRGVGDDVAHALGAVELAHVLHDLEAPLVVEVHIDIGHLGAFDGEEPLEHEAVLERVEGGDVHGVGDDGAGGRATARPHADAVLLGPAHVLLHDEEVVGEALGADDVVLELEALEHVDARDGDVAPVGAVPPLEARLALLAEALLRGLAGIEQRELGQVHVRPVELVAALGRDLEGVVERFGTPGEERAHLVLGLEVELGALHALAVDVIDLGVGADAAHGVLRGGVRTREVVDVVGRDDLDAQAVRELDQVLRERLVGPAVAEGEPVVLDLDVEVVAEDALEGAGPLLRLVEVAVEDVLGDDALHAGGGADEALMVALEHGERGAGPVVEHLVGGLGHHLEQVVVARLVLGEQDHVVATLGGRDLLDRIVGDEVGLATEDGLDERVGHGGVDVGEVVCAVPRGAVALPLGVDAVVLCGIGLIGRGLLEGPALLEALAVVLPLLEVGLVVVVAAAGEVEVGDAEQVAVIGEGDGGHAHAHGGIDHVGDARRTVEDGEIRVVVEMYEGHQHLFRIRAAPFQSTLKKRMYVR